MRAGGLGRHAAIAVRGAAPAAVVVCAALIATGCGSGESSGSSASTSGSTATSASTGGAKKSPSGGLQYDTTPQYAQPSSSEPVQSGVVEVAYRNIAIDPDTLRVKVGSTVRWTNYDPVEHNVTSKGGPDHFASKNFGEGGTVEFKLSKAGVIHYECTIHPTTMNGTIEVVK